MAFPSNTGTASDDLAQAWHMARGAAATIKSRSVSLRTASAAGPIGASTVVDYMTMLADQRDLLTAVAALTGIGAYAQAQIGNPGLDVAAAFTAMVNAINAVGGQIIGSFPVDGSGNLLAVKWQAGPTGRTVDNTFSTAAFASVRTLIDALIATID